MDDLERWADIKDSPTAVEACGERWKAIASAIGCTLHGFNDGRGAAFFTPDGNVIEVGPAFRAAIAALTTPSETAPERHYSLDQCDSDDKVARYWKQEADIARARIAVLEGAARDARNRFDQLARSNGSRRHIQGRAAIGRDRIDDVFLAQALNEGTYSE